ncbi:RICIN domain-containing protein [Micromonospora endophytica]|uniref:RICIN domain-containing protein n=1 Tax=Micromonospora endophytica TaxID=515350 RepID=UPI001BB3DC45|nr:hypothetical protein [Micromonospora endophytica]
MRNGRGWRAGGGISGVGVRVDRAVQELPDRLLPGQRVPPAGSVYGPVYTLPCQAGNNWQTWEVHGPKGTSPAGYEYVQVKNRATGMCLSMDEYGGPRLYTYACNSGTGAQRLEGVGSGWNRVKLRQNWFDNRLICLDTHGINDAYARACNDGLYQVWNLIR